MGIEHHDRFGSLPRPDDLLYDTLTPVRVPHTITDRYVGIGYRDRLGSRLHRCRASHAFGLGREMLGNLAEEPAWTVVIVLPPHVASPRPREIKPLFGPRQTDVAEPLPPKRENS